MKTRFNNRELVHQWASQSQESGKGSNMFFEKSVIYSYGYHFAIANIIDAETVLFTSRDYSNTTAKHKSYARGALRAGFTVFTVPNVRGGCNLTGVANIDHESNLQYLIQEYKTLHDKALRATTWADSYARHAVTDATDALRYTKKFKKYVSADLARIARRIAKHPFTGAELDLIKAREVRAEQARRERDKREDLERARRAEELKPQLELWASGAGPYLYGFHSLPVRLRVVKFGDDHGDIVETSHGAKVGEREARILLGAWQAGTVEIGAKIGVYTVESVSPEEIIIGCHKISRSEAERVLTGI